MSPSEAAALLGVPADAPIDEVHHALHRAARANHPDLMSEASDAERREAGVRFASLREARDTLLARHPVIPVVFERAPIRRHGIGGSVVILIILAAVLVASVTLADSYRSDMVERRQGGTIESP